jgi:hypothetical protein
MVCVVSSVNLYFVSKLLLKIFEYALGVKTTAKFEYCETIQLDD